jgi:hypothetical protein
MNVKATPEQIRNKAYQSALSEVITELYESGYLKEKIEMSKNVNEMILTFCKAFRKLTPEQKDLSSYLSKLMYLVHQNPIEISYLDPVTIQSHLKQIRILSVHVCAENANLSYILDEMLEPEFKKFESEFKKISAEAS